MARWQLILTVILTDRQHIASNFHLYLVPEHPNCILAFEHACKAVVLPFNLFTAPHQNHSICIHNQTGLSFACEKQNTEPHNGAKITFCFGNWYVLSSQCNVLTVRHVFFPLFTLAQLKCLDTCVYVCICVELPSLSSAVLFPYPSPLCPKCTC